MKRWILAIAVCATLLPGLLLAAEGEGFGDAASGILDQVLAFIQTPLGMAVATAVLAFVSKKFPTIGNVLTQLFDKFFRPANAPLPPNAQAKLVAEVVGTAEEGTDCAAAAESLQFLADHMAENGMPEEKLRLFISDAAPYLICTDHKLESVH